MFTGVLWELIPAEITSGQLYAGPGGIPASVASEAWAEIGVAYTEAAAEIQSITAQLRDNWKGKSADIATAKLEMFSIWLGEIAVTSGADGTKAATQSVANTTARVMMPTEAEILLVKGSIKALQIAGVVGDALGFTVVGLIVTGIVGGAQAAAEAAQHELDIRAGIAMDVYEVASTVVATIPTLFSPAPILGNGLALNPLEQMEQMAKHGIATAKGALTDTQKIKTIKSASKTKVTETNSKFHRKKAEAENHQKESKNLIENKNKVSEAKKVAEQAFDHTIKLVGDSVLSSAENTVKSLTDKTLDATGTAVKKIASEVMDNVSNALNDPVVISNPSKLNKINSSAINVTGLNATKLSTGRMHLTGSKLTFGQNNVGKSDLKGRSFNLKDLKNKVNTDKQIKTALASFSQDSKNPNAMNSNVASANKKEQHKRKKPDNQNKTKLNSELKSDKDFKLNGLVAPSVIGKKDK